MAKLLKGFAAKTDSGNVSDLYLGRQAGLLAQSLSQPFQGPSADIAVPADFSLAATIAATFSAAQGSTAVDDAELGGGKVLPEFPVLGCLSDKGLLLHYGLDTNLSGYQLTSDNLGAETMDEGTLNVIVGGSVSGVLDNPADHDSVTVFLISGQVYLISVRGTGATPAEDTFVNIFNPSAVNVGHDDDGGNDLNSLITITAAVTGNYTIDVSSANPFADVGGYTVDVRVRGVDAVGNTNATSVHLDPGTTFGFRESGTTPAGAPFNGDLDRYSVDLVAGHFYTFKYAGGSDYETGYYQPQTATNMDTFMTLRDAAGTVIAQNDDVGFPDDLSSAIGFYATVTGTYYLDLTAYSGYAGGYAIEFQDVNFAAEDPLDSIDWMDAANVPFTDVAGVPTAYVYFAVAGESFGELADNGVDPLPSYGWNAREQTQFMEALKEYEHILGTHYVVTTDVNQATFRVITTTSTQYGAYFYPQDPAFGTQQGIGAFNVNSGGWDKPGFSTQDIPGDQVSLDRGGFSFGVILHELGHAHGLAHPHDNGGGSDIMLGVTAAQGSYGLFNLNQGVYTVMSYNDAWDFHPDGPSPFTISGIDNGWSATLGAFDIAELQIRYGVHAYNGTDTVYTLTDVVDDAFYECIWDSGGNDTIAYGGTLSATIDLTAATLDYSPTGGGVVSYVIDPAPGTSPLRGGFTIANGVVIENATGGSGNDVLVGNSAANVLTGNDGNDNMIGRGGNDTLHGGAGIDTAFYDGNRADYSISAALDANGHMVITITDNNIAAPANSSNPIIVADEGTDTLDETMEIAHFADTSVALGTVALYDQTDTFVGFYTTIQAAINASSNGYRILAGAGTYAENLTVDKDVTIQGANHGTAGTDGARVDETIIDGQIKVTVAGVTIDGVEIVGDAPGLLGSTAVEVTGNNFSLVNSILDGSGNVAVITGTVTGLDIGFNLIEGYSIGLYVSGNTTAGSVHDNLFQGDGAGSGSGIQEGVFLETSFVILDTNTFDGIDGGSIFVNPHGPNAVDVRDILLNTTITDSGVDRPIQILASTLSTHLTGTDFNEAMYDPNQGLPGEINASLYLDGQGGDDHIFGNSLGDTLLGGAGQDEIYGYGGDDVITGGADNDLIDGEDGIDTALFADANLTFSDTLIGWLIGSSEGNDFLQRTEIAVNGMGQRNLLVGGTAFAGIQAAFDAAVANDTLRLAAGNYSGTFNYDVTGLTVIAQNGAVQNVTYTPAAAEGITVVAASGADTITTGAGNDVIFGNAGVDHLNGGGGNDALVGGTGDDVMTGGSGDDNMYVDSAGDVIVEAVGGGNDRVATEVSYTLAAGVEVETMEVLDSASTGAINLFGNEFANRLVGNAGANALVGGGGADTMIGLGGNDTYYVDNAGDMIEEAAGGGNDRIATAVSYALAAGVSVETIEAINSADTTAINLFGNELANRLVGNAGANALVGGGGADTMIGLGGNDTYYVDNAGDVVEEYAGQGSDRVATAISYTLAAGADVERLDAINIADTTAINLTGNAIAQTLFGNEGANVLDGKDGNDVLYGFGGADTFSFTSALGAGNVDAIGDFVSGTDKIALDDAVFTAVGATGALNANAFFAGAAAHDADDRIIYNQATGQLFYDADGNGAGAAVLFATVTGSPTLVASDFLVI